MDNKIFEKQLYLACSTNAVSDYALREIQVIQRDMCNDGSHITNKQIEVLQNLPRNPNKEELFVGANSQIIEQLKKSSPRISVIIPTHNRLDMLCRCVDSILQQDYLNTEILIIDDCSTDSTYEVIKEKYGALQNILYFCNDKNLGPGGSRHRAYTASTGEFIVFADDDDFYIEPTFFTKAIALMIEYPALSMVCANSIICNVEANTLTFEPVSFHGIMSGESFFRGFSSKYRKPNSTFPTVFRKSKLEDADFRDMKMMNDTSIYLRASCVGDVCMIKDWVGVYLVHASNISKALPHDFIIENLIEKHNIYNIGKKQFDFDLSEWYYEQLMVTVRYYLQSKQIEQRYLEDLLNWYEENGEGVSGKLKVETLNCYKNTRR